MNKNFKKLLEQSYSKAIEECIQRGHQVKQIDAIFNSIVMGEFAELIVKECAKLVDQDWHVSGAELKEHFGVEE
jgi:hypothetical protein